ADSTATLDAHITGPDGTRTTQASFTVAPTWLTTTQGTAVRGSFPVQFLTTQGYYDLHVDHLAKPTDHGYPLLSSASECCADDGARQTLRQPCGNP
ncbi:hypothetical protein, partial [Nocardia sp. NRRL S-836]|uniref:hypothetical protein n=1 Tax=Nocardia sp. NRRL S-836 TaxID=1519492 RepID=UPI0006AFD816